MATHTRGPWEVVDYDVDHPICGPCFCIQTTEDSPDYAHIAFSFDDAPANARLIAAAPDLLNALADILDHECQNLSDERYRRGYEAVAKAVKENS